MKQAKVYYNQIPAGELTQLDDGSYLFAYMQSYLEGHSYPPISVHFPKEKATFTSAILFPFFFNMLSEGANKRLQMQKFKINDGDYFDLLLKTACKETIGAVTVGPV